MQSISIYEHTDIPLGMTCDQYRRRLVPAKNRPQHPLLAQIRHLLGPADDGNRSR